MTSYFEDVAVGAVQEFGSYEVTAEEIKAFAAQYDPQPFHLSEDAGRAMIFGGLCASGWHTCAMAMRMIVDNMKAQGVSQTMGSPGLDALRWLRPVFPGDVLRVRTTVLAKRGSNSRPQLGLVTMRNEVFNQQDALVLSFEPTVMYRRREGASRR